MNRLTKSALLTLLLTSLSLPCLAAEATPERAQGAVKDMEALFTGAWSKKVVNSQEDTVKNILSEAEKERTQAKKALESNDFTNAIEYADKAKNSFLNAASKAKPQKSLAERQEEEYKQRLSNTATLMEAFEQAAKDAQRQGSGTKENLNNMIQDAKKLGANKKFKEANETLEKVSIAFKAIITSLMQGSTVTAEKDESPKGIFEYEIFRNDTYQSLIAMLNEKKLEITQDNEFLDLVKKGDTIRKEADAIGKKSEFESATQQMEESTKNYKAAAALAGIQIPE